MGTTTETTGALEVTLSQEQIDKFHERASCGSRRSPPRRRCSRSRASTTGCSSPAPRSPRRTGSSWPATRTPRPCCRRSSTPTTTRPSCARRVAYANAGEIARRLLGDEVVSDGHARDPQARQATAPRRRGTRTRPTGTRRTSTAAISIWMPLQPATLENGCMQFVPGSHHLGVQPAPADQPRLARAGAQSTWSWSRTRWPVRCRPAARPSTSSRTLHYAGPNTSDEPRRALIMAFARGAQPARPSPATSVAAARVVAVTPASVRNQTRNTA